MSGESSPRDYVVEFSHSCDGGHQEEQTAVEAIKQADPTARVTSAAFDLYPIRLTVKTNNGEVLWSDSQKKLYRKYPADRKNSISEIASAVQDQLRRTSGRGE